MTQTVEETAPPAAGEIPGKDGKPGKEDKKPFFIFYLEGEEFVEELRRLSIWVERLLLPVYGAEVTSGSPWCPRWREHPEAIGHLHSLWLAWQQRTGPNADPTGPLDWHRDLQWAMGTLRDPSGTFAGCKPGMHRAKERPTAENDGFLSSRPPGS